MFYFTCDRSLKFTLSSSLRIEIGVGVVCCGIGVHISRGARSIRRGVLPVRDVRRLHGTVAGTAVQLPVSTAHVRRAAHHHAHRLPAYLRHHRQKVARLPSR